MKTFIGVYIIAIFCFLSTSAGPSFLISYVSVLAAVMALNTIATDDMDNGMPYIFYFSYQQERIREGRSICWVQGWSRYCGLLLLQLQLA